MNTNRRRFLQILAAAPFAPWKEIAEELAKPIITYSIPAANRFLDDAAVQAIELEAWSKNIPNLFSQHTLIYTRLLGNRARDLGSFHVASVE
jgi:hypothetical protein